jgi:hypothetical protein
MKYAKIYDYQKTSTVSRVYSIYYTLLNLLNENGDQTLQRKSLPRIYHGRNIHMMKGSNMNIRKMEIYIKK